MLSRSPLSSPFGAGAPERCSPGPACAKATAWQARQVAPKRAAAEKPGFLTVTQVQPVPSAQPWQHKSGKNSGTKSYSRFGGRGRKRRRIDDVHYPLQDRDNGRFVNVEPLFQFLFQSSKLPGQFTLVAQERSHSQKRADNKTLTRALPIARSHHHATNAVYPTASPHVVLFLFGPRAVEDIARLDAASLLEDGGRRPPPPPLGVQLAPNFASPYSPTNKDFKHKSFGKRSASFLAPFIDFVLPPPN